MIRVIRIAVVIVRLLRLSLAVLLVLHPTVLEPYLHLAFSEIEVTRELPSFLLRDVSVEQEFLLQFESLELGVGLAFLPHRHLTRPFQRIATTAADTHAWDADTQ